MMISFSKKLTKILNESGLFEEKISHYLFSYFNLKKVNTAFVWKKNHKKAFNFAKKHKCNLVQIEDAFIAYLENSQGTMVNIGFYYDEGGKIYYSGNQNIIFQTIANKDYPENFIEEAKTLIKKIVENKITKYNKILQQKFTPTQGTAPILLIDQVYNDKSLTESGHGMKEFEKMYDLATKKANGRKIYIKTHPRGGGYLKKIYKEHEVVLIEGDFNIYDVLSYVDEIWVVSSQSGFEGLLAGKTVHTFGTPFYAGYGLTQDDISQNKGIATLEEIFYASYVKACRYFIGKIECTLEEICDVIIEHKRLTEKDSKINRLFAFNIPAWKMYSMLAFIFKKNLKVIRITNYKQLEKHKVTSQDIVIVWGFAKTCENLTFYAKQNNIPIWTFEDGFIRSVGLGSDFVLPYSFAIDKFGIYYNYHQKSELEVILQNLQISQEQIKRIENFKEMFKIMNISKYNILNDNHEKFSKNSNKKTILITGQVCDDMSIIKGGTQIFDYKTLIPIIRKENPNAYIIYKHHPDVISGNRKGYIEDDYLAQYVDLNVKHINIVDLIRISDEIHTITSLSGLEALMHGKKVVCWGMPFYNGYGFTIDKSGINHGRKPVDLNTFIYASLFLYPRYTIITSSIALTPEIIIKKLYANMQNSTKQQKISYIKRKALQGTRLIKLYFKQLKLIAISKHNGS